MRALHAEKSSLKADGIAAGTLHMIKQHYFGKLRLTNPRFERGRWWTSENSKRRKGENSPYVTIA
jgi:hypothetical protein